MLPYSKDFRKFHKGGFWKNRPICGSVSGSFVLSAPNLAKEFRQIMQFDDFPEMAKKFCPQCGTKITDHMGRPRSFCSERCRRNWWKVHPEFAKPRPSALYAYRCRTCGQPFTAYGNRHRIYCSRACYLQDRYHKQKGT